MGIAKCEDCGVQGEFDVEVSLVHVSSTKDSLLCWDCAPDEDEEVHEIMYRMAMAELDSVIEDERKEVR